MSCLFPNATKQQVSASAIHLITTTNTPRLDTSSRVHQDASLPHHLANPPPRGAGLCHRKSNHNHPLCEGENCFQQHQLPQIVAGIVGSYLDDYSTYQSTYPPGRFIYVQVISGISIIFAILWSFPFTYDFILDWPMDLILSAAWFAAFGLLVNWLNANGCGGTFNWGDMANGGYCGKWRPAEAFSFLSAICWLANAIIGMTMVYAVAFHEAVAGFVY
jgi:Membrane-associating domain